MLAGPDHRHWQSFVKAREFFCVQKWRLDISSKLTSYSHLLLPEVHITSSFFDPIGVKKGQSDFPSFNLTTRYDPGVTGQRSCLRNSWFLMTVLYLVVHWRPDSGSKMQHFRSKDPEKDHLFEDRNRASSLLGAPYILIFRDHFIIVRCTVPKLLFRRSKPHFIQAMRSHPDEHGSGQMSHGFASPISSQDGRLDEGICDKCHHNLL